MTKQDLRIIYMGTPEFAVEPLKRMIENGYNVVAVVTQPDKPVGRHGSVLQAPPVKQFALEKGLPVLQPEKMKAPDFIETLRTYRADLQVVVAFRMLPEMVWAMPRFGTFNVHAALLPQYRGAAPINWAVINGETRTGVTTFFLDHDIDTGCIIRQMPFDIPDEADVEYVYDGLMHLGADICMKTLEDIILAEGHPHCTPQQVPADGLHPAPKLFKDTCRIDWHQSAKHVYDFVRGLSPYPGSWTELNTGQVLKIYHATKTQESAGDYEPGQLVLQRRRLLIACADDLLQIDKLQLAGKKRMDAACFVNGLPAGEKYFVS